MGYASGHEWTPREIQKVQDFRAKGMTRQQIADHMGFSYDSVNAVFRKYINNKHITSPASRGMVPLDKISDDLMMRELSSRGFRVEQMAPEKTARRVRIDPKLFEGEAKKFGVVSCTHLGSKYQQLTHIRSFYAYAQDQGCKVIFHAGDMVDGERVYGGQQFERFLHGVKAQRDYAIEHYPKMHNGGKTFVIDGNHDHSFWKWAGESILEGVAAKRDDIEYLGTYGAYPRVLGLNIYLQHGAGGGAYARSYKMQKNIEMMAPDKKPDIYLLGHYHASCLLLEYRNVAGFQLPSFQAQTPFAVRHGWPAEIGGFIITIVQNARERKGGTSKINFEFVPFYVPIEGDY